MPFDSNYLLSDQPGVNRGVLDAYANSSPRHWMPQELLVL
jgi:hypothetical protein